MTVFPSERNALRGKGAERDLPSAGPSGRIGVLAA